MCRDPESDKLRHRGGLLDLDTGHVVKCESFERRVRASQCFKDRGVARAKLLTQSWYERTMPARPEKPQLLGRSRPLPESRYHKSESRGHARMSKAQAQRCMGRPLARFSPLDFTPPEKRARAMSNVVPFSKPKPSTPETLAGMIDVFASGNGMVQFDGCIPAAIVPSLLEFMAKAKVKVILNAA
jgi:hypothetical protein